MPPIVEKTAILSSKFKEESKRRAVLENCSIVSQCSFQFHLKRLLFWSNLFDWKIQKRNAEC